MKKRWLKWQKIFAEVSSRGRRLGSQRCSARARAPTLPLRVTLQKSLLTAGVFGKNESLSPLRNLSMPVLSLYNGGGKNSVLGS
jgi:hypothetical protein